MCGVGEPGELLLSGPRLGRGYRGRPDLTADKFIPNPFYDTTTDLPPHIRKHYRCGWARAAALGVPICQAMRLFRVGPIVGKACGPKAASQAAPCTCSCPAALLPACHCLPLPGWCTAPATW